MEKELLARTISKMKFTALDYALDPEAILGQALGELSKISGNTPDRDEVTAALEQSGMERRMFSVENVDMPVHLMNGDEFTVYLNNATRLSARIGLSPKKISLEMHCPFPGLRAESKLEMMVPLIWTVRPEEGSEADEMARDRAASLLLDLYYENIRRFVSQDIAKAPK